MGIQTQFACHEIIARKRARNGVKFADSGRKVARFSDMGTSSATMKAMSGGGLKEGGSQEVANLH